MEDSKIELFFEYLSVVVNNVEYILVDWRQFALENNCSGQPKRLVVQYACTDQPYMSCKTQPGTSSSIFPLPFFTAANYVFRFLIANCSPLAPCYPVAFVPTASPFAIDPSTYSPTSPQPIVRGPDVIISSVIVYEVTAHSFDSSSCLSYPLVSFLICGFAFVGQLCWSERLSS